MSTNEDLLKQQKKLREQLLQLDKNIYPRYRDESTSLTSYIEYIFKNTKLTFGTELQKAAAILFSHGYFIHRAIAMLCEKKYAIPSLLLVRSLIEATALLRHIRKFPSKAGYFLKHDVYYARDIAESLERDEDEWLDPTKRQGVLEETKEMVEKTEQKYPGKKKRKILGEYTSEIVKNELPYIFYGIWLDATQVVHPTPLHYYSISQEEQHMLSELIEPSEEKRAYALSFSVDCLAILLYEFARIFNLELNKHIITKAEGWIGYDDRFEAGEPTNQKTYR